MIAHILGDLSIMLHGTLGLLATSASLALPFSSTPRIYLSSASFTSACSSERLRYSSAHAPDNKLRRLVIGHCEAKTKRSWDQVLKVRFTGLVGTSARIAIVCA